MPIALILIILFIPIAVGLYFALSKDDKKGTNVTTETSNNTDVASELKSSVSDTRSTEPQPSDAWKADIRTIRQWVQFFGWFTIASFIISIIATLIILD